MKKERWKKKKKNEIDKIESINSKILDFQAKNETNTLELKHLKENRELYLQKKKEKSREKEEFERIKKEHEDILVNIVDLKKSLEDNKESLLINQKQIENLGYINCSQIKKKISSLETEKAKNYENRSLLNEEIQKYQILIKNKNEKHESGISIFKKKYHLKQFYEFFDEEKLLELCIIEPILEDYKDYYVLESKMRNLIEEIKKVAIDSNLEINVIMLEELGSIKKLFSTEQISVNDLYFTSLFKNQLIKITKSVKTPKIFGNISRKNHIKSLKFQVDIINNKNSEIESKLDSYRELVFSYKTNISEKNQISKKIKNIIKKHDIDKFIKEQEALITNYGKNIEEINNILNDIPSDKAYQKNILDLQNKINEYSENISEKKVEERERRDELQKIYQKLEEIDEISKLSQEKQLKNLTLFDKISLNLNNNFLELKKKISNQKSFSKIYLEISNYLTQHHQELYKKLVDLEGEESKLNFVINEIKQDNKKIEDEKNKILSKKKGIEEEISLISQKGFVIIGRKLYVEAKIEEIVESKYDSILEMAILKQNSNKKENIFQFDFFNEWDSKIRRIAELFNKDISLITIRDENGNLRIDSLFKILNFEIDTIKIQDYLLQKLKDIDEELEKTLFGFIAEISGFLNLIISEIKDFKRTAQKYNDISSHCHFGSLKKIHIELYQEKQLEAIRKFRDELLNAKDSMQSNDWIIQLINKNSNSLTEFFSKKIFNDPHAKSEDFLDIHKYYTIEVLSINNKGEKRNALSSSGGESTGIKFLMYALAFQNLRSKSITKNNLTYAKPIFIYFDEAASVDDKGISSVMSLSDELKINAIIAMVDSPKIHDKRIIDYILVNGVIAASSEIISEIELGLLPN